MTMAAAPNYQQLGIFWLDEEVETLLRPCITWGLGTRS